MSADLNISVPASPRFVHGGLPSYMRGRLVTASAGGTHGYEEAGYTFGRALEHECPYRAELDEWYVELEALSSIVEDDAQLGPWLKGAFPRVPGLVPDRRLGNFGAGVRRAYDER